MRSSASLRLARSLSDEAGCDRTIVFLRVSPSGGGVSRESGKCRLCETRMLGPLAVDLVLKRGCSCVAGVAANLKIARYERE